MKSLAIDASIAVGAGGMEKVKPASRQCRDFLIEALNSGHRLTWTNPIAAEWKKHAAGFARRWRVEMFGRRRVDRRSAPEVQGLCKRITSALKTPAERTAAAKDCHLLYAALDSDKRIASLDDLVRRLFARACPAAKEIRPLVWVNPNHDSEQPVEWLREGSPAEPQRTLERFLQD